MKKVAGRYLQLIYKVSTSEKRNFLLSETVINFLNQFLPYEQNVTLNSSLFCKEFKTVQKQIQRNSPKHKGEDVC